jgi:hypothetical protein
MRRNVWTSGIPIKSETAARRDLALRNIWIDGGALVVFGVSFTAIGSASLETQAAPSIWSAGVLLTLPFAAMILFVCAATLPRGSARLAEFWRYHQMRHGIGGRRLAGLYAALALIGLVSAVKIWL